jgi:parallel beta-helix repeat protein
MVSFANNVMSGIQADLAPLNNLRLLRNKVYRNGNGIVLSNVTRVVVQGNSVTHNANYGVWASGVADYTFTGNTVAYNGINIAVVGQGAAVTPCQPACR